MLNPIISGFRLYLRPFESGDAGMIARLYHEEPDREPFLGGRNPISPITMDRLIEGWHQHQPPGEIHFAVGLTADDSLIGWVSLWALDWVNRTAETASFMLPKYRNRGYGTEAKHLLLEYAFERIQLKMVWASTWELNARSAAALVKQGYRPAGHLKWMGVNDGTYRDTLLFDLTYDEWLAARDTWRAEQPKWTTTEESN